MLENVTVNVNPGSRRGAYEVTVGHDRKATTMEMFFSLEPTHLEILEALAESAARFPRGNAATRLGYLGLDAHTLLEEIERQVS